MVIETERGEIEARAKVTRRVGPLRVDGGARPPDLPARGTGAATRPPRRASRATPLNDLIVLSGDPNTSIEDKTFSCQVRAGRRGGETTEKLAGVAAARSTRRPTMRPRSRTSSSTRRRAARMTEIADPRAPRRSAWASSPTRRCASAARRARSPASSGTTCPPTARTSARAARSTTPARCRRSDLAARALRRDRAGGRLDLRRTDGAGGSAAARARDGPLAVRFRRLQALHERGLPGRLPDRRADPHRVRDRDRAVRHLQRLRLLRPVVPVRGHRPRPLRRAGRQVHALLRPPRRTASSRRARRRARPTRSSSARTTSWSSGRKGRVVELHERGVETRLPLRRRRRGPRAARRRARRVLPADRAARALRPARPGRLADPGRTSRSRPRRGLAAGVVAAADGDRRRRCWRTGGAAMSHGRKTAARAADPPSAKARVHRRARRHPRGRHAAASPDAWRRAVEGAEVRGFKPRLRGRALVVPVPRRRHALPVERADGRRGARRRAPHARRAPRCPVAVKGPIMRPNVWTWEVPALLLVRRDRQRRVVRRPRLRGRGRRALRARRAHGRGRRRRCRRRRC